MSLSEMGGFFIMSIQGQKRVKLTEETILSKISEYDIFKMYMPGNWKLNIVTNSPFRKDDNPSFVIGTKHGNISFIDFADISKKGNCFNFVQMICNLPSYYDALKLIDRDFSLGISSGKVGDYKKIVNEYKQPDNIEKRYSLVQAITRKFTKEELDYWNQYHQSEDDLKANNVYSLSKVYLNKQLFYLKNSDLRFGYLYNGHWKIYRPFVDPKMKWMPNNVPITTMDGKKDIIDCKMAIITKSKKDYMVLKKIYPNVCAVQNESIVCFSDDNLEYIKANSDRQTLSFDSDPTGVKNSQQITKVFDFDYINVPRSYLSDGIKDFADLSRDYGMSAVEKVLKKKKLL